MVGIGELRQALFENVLDLLALLVEDCCAAGVARQVAAFALDQNAAGPVAVGANGTRLLRNVDVADLADYRGGAVIQERDQCVGGLAVVVEGEAAADADRPRGRLVLSQRPAADVDDVDAVVAHLAIAGGPEPVPVVVQLLAHQRPLGRRAAPEIVIDRGGHRRGLADFADAGPRAVDDGAGPADCAELAAAKILECLLQGQTGTALRAHLDHAAMLAGGGDHLPAFPEVVAERLFHVDVLARLTGPDGCQGVPMIRQGDDHRVDILVVQQLTDVVVGGNAGAAFFHGRSFTIEVGTVYIAKGDNPGAGDLADRVDKLVSAAADATDGIDVAQAHDADADLVIGHIPFRRGVAAQDEVWQSQRGCCCGRTLQKLAACCSWHGLAPGWVDFVAGLLPRHKRRSGFPA